MAATRVHHVSIGDTRLFVAERGDGYPVLLLHGGPGLDHHVFGDYLDPLANDYRLLFVDQRAQGRSDAAPNHTWTLEQMAKDVSSLARALGLERYAVLGHSYGAFVALQHACDFPGDAAQVIVSNGLASSRWLKGVDHNLAAFEPVELRVQLTQSWARERSAATHEDVASLLHDQLPFQFGDPLDPRIEEYERRAEGARYSPDVLRFFAQQDYGGIDVEGRLGGITQPVLVIGGRRDRTCALEAAGEMARAIPLAELAVFESGHMTFVEENELYLQVVRDFLSRHAGLDRARSAKPV